MILSTLGKYASINGGEKLIGTSAPVILIIGASK